MSVYVTTLDQLDGQAMKLDGAAGVTLRVLIGRGHGAKNFAMRHFTVDVGGHTPLHRHNYEHQIFVLSGKGMARSNDTYRGIHAGQCLLIPSDELHEIKNTGNAPLQFICVVPLQFDCGGICQPTPGT
jgi:quercetin dioxygenase-like cupin family protein